MNETTARAIGFFGHHGVGKTSLLDALAHRLGVTDRLGRVDAGTSLFDTDAEEVRHHLTCKLSVLSVALPTGFLHLVDTPGYLDLVGEVEAALTAVEAAVLVLDGAAGWEVGAEYALDRACSRGVPVIVAINRLDRPNADFERTLQAVRDRLGNGVVPAGAPVGLPSTLEAVQSLLADSVDDNGHDWYTALTDLAAESDDGWLARYLDGESLTADERRWGLTQAFRDRRWIPVVPLAGPDGLGLEVLISLLDLTPVLQATGQPSRALVFKTSADPFVGRLSLIKVKAGHIKPDSILINARSGQPERLGSLLVMKGGKPCPVQALGPGDIGAVAKLEARTGDSLLVPGADELEPPVFPDPKFPQVIVPVARPDEDKVGPALIRLTEEDPSLRLEHEGSSLVLWGQGEFHIQLMVERLERKFGVRVQLAELPIPYRETIRSASRAEGRHKKQTGGHGQFGHVWLELEPLPEGQFEFVDRIFGGAVPQQYRPAVEKGIRDAMAEGILAGYPMTGVRAVLADGSYHPVDSSEMAFRIAGALAFRKAAQNAKPVLLEPVGKLQVMVPRDLTGDIIGDLNRRRAHLLGVDSEGASDIIRAEVPLAEVRRYAVDLRALTQGRGFFTVTFDHYREAPPPVIQQIIAERRQA